MFTSTYKCMVNLLFSYYNITHNDSSQNNNPDVSSPSTNTNTALLLSLISLGNNQISGILTCAAAELSRASTTAGVVIGICARICTALDTFTIRNKSYQNEHKPSMDYKICTVL